MARSLEIVVGRRDRFAVRVAFQPDPHEGQAATLEQSLSWGGLEIWVNGHNVCGHVEMNERVEPVHWYLLSFLQWLAANWDFLLHEERLPTRNAASDAWVAMLRTSEAPSGLSDFEAEEWGLKWHAWWGRHCLLACRDGGLFPALFIRRLQDTIEFSWGDRPVAGAPEHFTFNAHHGWARLRPDDVAGVLFDVLDNAARHLHEEMPASPAFGQLVEDVKRLQHSDRRRRLGLLSGRLGSAEDPIRSWESVVSAFPLHLSSEDEEAIFGADETALVTSGASQAALMFGSLSPTVDEADARLLAEKLVEYCSREPENLHLRNLVREVPVEGGGEEAWDQGYRLAEDALEQLGGQFQAEGYVDIEKVFEHLAITIDQIALRDKTIRAVAVAGPGHQPVVLVNESFQYRDTEPRRFTLAHELCHLLHDRSYGARLAMASGPWAPRDVERRANAFAAMFLMPDELLGSVVRALPIPLDSPHPVWKVANRLQTSFTSTVEHLCNLGYLDETTRDSIRETMVSRVARDTDS